MPKRTYLVFFEHDTNTDPAEIVVYVEKRVLSRLLVTHVGSRRRTHSTKLSFVFLGCARQRRTGYRAEFRATCSKRAFN